MLEYLVRPYQSPRGGAILIPSTPAAPTEKATLTWGAKMTLPTVKGMGVNVACCKENSTEKQRNSAIIRVSNPEDDSQYVDVARPVTVGLNKKEHATCNDGWDQFSDVGMQITDALAEFAADINSGTTAGNDQPSQCTQSWNLNTDLRSNEQFLRYEQSTTSQSGVGQQ
jgi:hypothetical protein